MCIASVTNPRLRTVGGRARYPVTALFPQPVSLVAGPDHGRYRLFTRLIATGPSTATR